MGRGGVKNPQNSVNVLYGYPLGRRIQSCLKDGSKNFTHDQKCGQLVILWQNKVVVYKTTVGKRWWKGVSFRCHFQEENQSNY